MRVLRTPARCGLLAVALVVAGTPELSAQPQGPIKLFPDVGPSDQPAPAGPGGERRGGGPRPRLTPPDAPGDPDQGGVLVEGLQAPEIDAIGRPGGLEPAIWQGTDPERVIRLIDRLPVARDNRPLQDLAHRLLVTGAVFGDGASPGAMLAVRVRKLMAMGALEEAAALLDQLPDRDDDGTLTRAFAEVALWRGAAEAACRLVETVAPVSEARFWGRHLVFCRERAGDADGAALALDLLREAGAPDDRRFLALAEGRVDEPNGERPWSALEVAMLEAAGGPLPAGAIAEASGPLLTALAMRPALAGEAAIAVGERAFRSGAIGRDRLAGLYRSATPEPPADPGRRLDRGPLPEARAVAFVMLDAGLEPSDAARIFDRLWSRTPAEERELTAAVFAPLLNELPALDELQFAAPALIRALLAAGYPGPASNWFRLLQKHAAADVTAREALAAVVPLLAIGGVGDREVRFDRQAFEAWRASAPEDAPDASRLLALLEGAGRRVPIDLWWQVDGDQRATGGAPVAGVIWRILERARGSGAAGEAILAALHLLGDAPAAAEREALIAGLSALREAGLAEEARRIATVAAVRSGL